ncbi:hypothetical protein MIR68_000260 [Amoeboaphelidium protococcarum]|nr:hypothetical protein MIR68_000260 [Amoeboaphelidium protococcarum]
MLLHYGDRQFMITLIIALACFLHGIQGSSGDRDINYQACLKSCACPIDEVESLFRYSCLDKCKYDCMFKMVNHNMKSGESIEQYYGKWPFKRIFGLQEPASVLFSLLNLYGQSRGLLKVQRRVSSKFKLKMPLMILFITQMNAWVWSSVFHYKDMPWTERMDYFAAMLSIVYGMFYATVRMSFEFKRSQWKRIAGMSAFISVLFYTCHILYLTNRERFDYTYNMIAGVSIGLAHNFIWIVWISLKWKHFHARFLLILIVTVMLGMLLEVFDFPPLWFVFDAHSLWHLVTGIVSVHIHKFYILDADYLLNNEVILSGKMK